MGPVALARAPHTQNPHVLTVRFCDSIPSRILEKERLKRIMGNVWSEAETLAVFTRNVDILIPHINISVSAPLPIPDRRLPIAFRFALSYSSLVSLKSYSDFRLPREELLAKW